MVYLYLSSTSITIVHLYLGVFKSSFSSQVWPRRHIYSCIWGTGGKICVPCSSSKLSKSAQCWGCIMCIILWCHTERCFFTSDASLFQSRFRE